MDREVNVAVIGAGYWGTKLINEYLALSAKDSRVRLAAVVDIDKARLERVAAKVGTVPPMLTDSLDSVLSDKNINAVHIATPNETHFEVASKALCAGKHVLLEKPMALNPREAFKLARLAEQESLTLLVGHIYRFNNAVIKSREIIEQGLLGEVRYVTLTWMTLMSPPPGRDIIFDLAPHPIDILNYLLNEWPSAVFSIARSYIRRKKGLEDTAFILADLPRERMASITLSWLQHGQKTRAYTVVSSEATLEVDALRQRMTLHTENREKNVNVTPNNTIEAMIRHFVDRIVKGDPPKNSALVGAMTVTVLSAIRKSLRESIPVSVL